MDPSADGSDNDSAAARMFARSTNIMLNCDTGSFDASSDSSHKLVLRSTGKANCAARKASKD